MHYIFRLYKNWIFATIYFFCSSITCSIVDVIGKATYAAGSALAWALFGIRSDSEDVKHAAIEEQEKEFHEFIREQIICLLFFISLYLISYYVISVFKAKSDFDSLYAGDEDYFVYRISVWICTVSLTVSVGSIALLPFSVLGSELLQRFPDNYYLQWLSWSLIHTFWNYVFALSNLSLFVLLPFSYFFIESQGFSKNKNGIMQRVYETLAVCALLIVVILCLVDVVLALLSSSVSLLSITSVNLPLIYSCVSFCGVGLLLVSTPIGFARMFSIVGEMAIIPVYDVDELTITKLEMFCERRKTGVHGKFSNTYTNNNNVHKRHTGIDLHIAQNTVQSGTRLGLPRISKDITRIGGSQASTHFYLSANPVFMSDISKSNNSNEHSDDRSLVNRLETRSGRSYLSCSKVPLRQKSLRWYYHVMFILKYPVIIISLLLLTGISLLMVIINSLSLMFGYRGLPAYAQYIEVQTRHTLGMPGAITESITILYVMATSLVGLYSMPFVRTLRPIRGKTSMTAIIINCSLVLVLSSALPVLANTLGITTFDLLGAYSSLEWLSNFRLVLAYNVLFAAATMFCLVSQVTNPVRKQIIKRLYELRYGHTRSDEPNVKSD